MTGMVRPEQERLVHAPRLWPSADVAVGYLRAGHRADQRSSEDRDVQEPVLLGCVDVRLGFDRALSVLTQKPSKNNIYGGDRS